jgi:hypothetical protein
MPTVQELYRSDLRFLLKLKEAVGILHNRIHDNLARTAVEHFKEKYPKWEFTYVNAGVAGIDITGCDRRGAVTLIAEVKTSLPNDKGKIRSPQTTQIKKDLERLRDYSGSVVRYMVLVSAVTVEAVKKQLSTDRDFPTVSIFNALDDDLRDPTDEE